MMAYLKAVVSLLFAAATLLASSLSDGVVTPVEWIQVAIGGVTAFSVLMTANVPGAMAAKTVIAAALAGLTFLVGAIGDGMTPAEWINLVLAAGGVLAVWATPNPGAVQFRRTGAMANPRIN
jgi:hypothetical protein